MRRRKCLKFRSRPATSGSIYVLTERDVIDFPARRDMRILFIGDIVGRSGRHILLDRMPKLIAEWTLDLVVSTARTPPAVSASTEAI